MKNKAWLCLLAALLLLSLPVWAALPASTPVINGSLDGEAWVEAAALPEGTLYLCADSHSLYFALTPAGESFSFSVRAEEKESPVYSVSKNGSALSFTCSGSLAERSLPVREDGAAGECWEWRMPFSALGLLPGGEGELLIGEQAVAFSLPQTAEMARPHFENRTQDHVSDGVIALDSVADTDKSAAFLLTTALIITPIALFSALIAGVVWVRSKKR